MTRQPLSLLAALFLGLGVAAPGHATQILHWKRLPLAVPLTVGQERVVFLDRKVRVGVPTALSDRLRIQSTGGALYLRASTVVPPTRLQVQDVQTGMIILLDVAAEPAKSGQPAAEPIRIVLDAPDEELPPAPNTPEAGTAQSVPDAALAMTLTRYAAQRLYAPLRTLEPVEGIRSVAVEKALPLDSLLPGLLVRAHALAVWQLQHLRVTAVRLSNQSARPIALVPEALQGDFVAATFQHPDLGPSGQATDTTVVYLVTRHQGLRGALLPRITPFPDVTPRPPVLPALRHGNVDEDQ
ncbi:integrating conjugative element protein (TIGR03749 family) [Pseudomonas sp. SORGH_AS199]|uniref:TIGR03749 family integrating conjugative element protein n=1 Tax=Pseudomonas sp. SORGH_AS_0199 TaxID=3041761 RepID=UPI002863DB86|nr:TIGR03749 family integrating conjugative element protein [Pseudomonas sp. SORGH_AS_0199]MDR6228025.1 integrating conjugative element protein (TIGR03749 family) [Pseudomonas sp. SORGH_AS_0199]